MSLREGHVGSIRDVHYLQFNASLHEQVRQKEMREWLKPVRIRKLPVGMMQWGTREG